MEDITENALLKFIPNPHKSLEDEEFRTLNEQFEKTLSPLQNSYNPLKHYRNPLQTHQIINLYNNLPGFYKRRIGNEANQHWNQKVINYDTNYFNLTYGQQLHVYMYMYITFFTPDQSDLDL